MIKKIVIRDVASYDSEGVVLDDLQKVNFIYGGNGTGKTTIGRVLRSANREEEYPNCEVEWDGEELPVLVYNKDFRDRNFAEYIPGIFTLGENMVAAEKEIEQLKREQYDHLRTAGEARDGVEQCEKDIKKEKKNLVETLWQMVYMPNRRFKKCIGEQTEKQMFAEKLIKLSKNQTLKKPTHQKEEELNKRNTALYKREEIEVWKEFGTIDDIVRAMAIERDPMWKEPIVRSNDIPLGAYVKDEALRENLRKLFEEGYHEKLNKIAKMESYYNQQIETIEQRAKEVLEQCKTLKYDLLDADDYEKMIRLLLDNMKDNDTLMVKKIRNPKSEIVLNDTMAQVKVLKEMIEEVNKKVRMHNKALKQLNNERKKLRNDVWRKLAWDAKKYVEESERLIADKEREKHGYESAEKKARAEYERKETRIKEKQEDVVSIQPTVDHINQALRQFGFTGFSLQPSKEQENHYQIERDDGSLVMDTLSEGEVTFITFLYYMQMALKEDSEKKRVLVIDDPISSLDSQVMFVVGTMIRQELNKLRSKKEVKTPIVQVFVLTHNVYFHKEVTFINTRVNKSTVCYHWMLYKHGKVTSVKAYQKDNPIKGSYDLLWQELRDCKGEVTEMDNVRLQNILRRIIENYFVVFGGYRLKQLIPENFTDDPEERAIALSFARWYDEGSHDVMDDLYVEAPQTMNERYMAVFRKVFEKLGHLAHYNMMMQDDASS